MLAYIIIGGHLFLFVFSYIEVFISKKLAFYIILCYNVNISRFTKKGNLKMGKTNDIFEVSEKEMKKKSKRIKATGLKSTLIFSDKLLMTSFGKGNDAILEKEIIDDQITALNNPESFSIKADGKKFKIKGNGITGLADNPFLSEKEIGEDIIDCKDTLEEKYFGKTFSDNIHIQLIYNILDITKILAVHINNIAYEFDNLFRDGSVGDFIGYMSSINRYSFFMNPPESHFAYQNIISSRDKFNMLKKNPRLAYFGDIFFTYDKKTRKSVVNEKRLYYIMALIGDIRQFCFHGGTKMSPYIPQSYLNEESKNILDSIYDRKIKNLNSNFLATNAKNLEILFDVLKVPNNKKADITKDFYNYIVRKANKNIGFSIKKLREQMIDANCPSIKEQKYDSCRSKFYRLLDFIIYSYYVNTPDKIEKNVAKLRSCLDDEQKDMFYVKEAVSLWADIKTYCEDLRSKMNTKTLHDRTDYRLISDDMKKTVNEIAIKSDSDYFCKLIYLLTNFMDGKEINDLLTTLINKFENIASFTDVMDKYNIEYSFTKDFEMFEKSKEIASDLRVVNSFARMTTAAPDAKKIMYIEAAQVLGMNVSAKETEEYIDRYLLNSEFKKGQKNFRNFIASNVIESSRFKYLIRYANPEKIRTVAENEQLVRFVLEKIPQTQIERYYFSCFQKRSNSIKEQIDALTGVITKMDFRDFENVKQNGRSFEEKQFKAKKQAAITLYLTILYLIVKNLVYVNSRYTIAFHCAERDMLLHQMNPKEKNWLLLTEKLIKDKKAKINAWFDGLTETNRNQRKRKWRIERSCSYLSDNLKNTDNSVIIRYRNSIAHLDIIRNMDKYIKDVKSFKSYFELYHYLMQRTLIKDCKLEAAAAPQILNGYANAVLTHNSYCKDFVKALNIPFGYNLSRFKNLSVDELFDRNN